MSSIHEFVRDHQGDLPGYDLVHFFDAALPVYKVFVKVLVQRRRPLPVVSEFVLKSVGAGLESPIEIGDFLGIDRVFVREAEVDLLSRGFLRFEYDENNTERLLLTELGRKAAQELTIDTSHIAVIGVLIDGLTNTVKVPREGLLSKKMVKELGLDSIPSAIPFPDERSLDFKAISRVVRAAKAQDGDRTGYGDLLEILSLENAFAEYRRGRILVFRDRKSGEYEVIVYERNQRIMDYERIIMRLEREGVFTIPTVQREDFDNQESTLTKLLPASSVAEAKQTSERVAMLHSRLKVLETMLREEEAQASLSTTEQESDQARTYELRLELDELKHRFTEESAQQRILSTYEHRPVLEQALSEASSRVVIISPWLRNKAMDDDLIGRIDKATQRGVQVIVGHGISDEPDQESSKVLAHLRHIQGKKHGKNLRVEKLGNTHEKVLICDERFAVVTSFNWLSFRGDHGFRQETGLYTEDRKVVKRLLDDILSRVQQTI